MMRWERENEMNDDIYIDVIYEDEYDNKSIKVEGWDNLQSAISLIFEEKSVRHIEINSREECLGLQSKPILETTHYITRKEWEKIND
jgi:hypothetical protein